MCQGYEILMYTAGQEWVAVSATGEVVPVFYDTDNIFKGSDAAGNKVAIRTDFQGKPEQFTPEEEQKLLAADNLEYHHAIKMLRLVYRKDVAMECRYADDMITLANATKLVLTPHVGKEFLPDTDADAWSLQLPPATIELQVLLFWYVVRPPHIHGAGISALRSLTLLGDTVVREDFLLAATVFPLLEDLHIGECTLAASMSVTSDTMPRLKHLRFTDISVRTVDTKAAITMLTDDLRTLCMSCHWYRKTESPSELLLFLYHSGVTAVFTKYLLFRLHAPKLAVFEWRCCYANEVRIEAMGRLSDVAIEVAAGRMRTSNPIGTESKYMTIQQRDKLVTDILQGLMPRLQPRTWKDVTRYVYT
ncbi:uncharacterized protein [Miscanthus floridulus]|uniref:uncharacterized protein n=1 Tax=Miscanthus floridulus TaxID=154761 RepID=UPI00345B070D